MNGTKSSNISKKKYRQVKKAVDNHIQYCKNELERHRVNSIDNTSTPYGNTECRPEQNVNQYDLNFVDKSADNENVCASLAQSSYNYEEVDNSGTDWCSDNVACHMSCEGVHDEELHDVAQTLAFDDAYVYSDELNNSEMVYCSGCESGDILDRAICQNQK